MWQKIATCCVCLHNGELVAASGVCKTAGSTPLASKCAEFRTRDSRSPDPSIPSAIERTATWHSLNRTQTPEIRESRSDSISGRMMRKGASEVNNQFSFQRLLASMTSRCRNHASPYRLPLDISLSTSKLSFILLLGHGGFRDFYHNWTNSILQQLKRKFEVALFRIS